MSTEMNELDNQSTEQTDATETEYYECGCSWSDGLCLTCRAEYQRWLDFWARQSK